MIPLLLMLADAPAATPVEAERAFAADARTIGQWTAFRKWSTDDAVMFIPQPTNAHSFLNDLKDPAKVIDWWPTASWISCDGKLAVNTGGWKRPDGSVGYFTTVWQKQVDGDWKWIVDGGDDLKVARDHSTPVPISAAICTGKPTASPQWIYEHSGAQMKNGISPDGTLSWQWVVHENGSREFFAWTWSGKSWASVVADRIAAPK